MNYSNIERVPANRILFVWDGHAQSIRFTEKFALTVKNSVVKAIYVKPHESIRTYGTIGYFPDEPSGEEKYLISMFDKQASKTSLLRNSKLEVVFGDRVYDVVRFADVIRAKYILMPAFSQSSFSKWMHGDLNERVRSSASCPVVFFGLHADSATNNSEVSDRDPVQRYL